MRKKNRRKSKKGNVVKKSDEFVDYENYSSLKDVPGSRKKGSGIYALYNPYGLYYIGLSNSSIRSRIRSHTKDRHRGKWNKFSWYQIPRVDHVKDIETTLLRIVNPAGNKQMGKFRKKKRT